MCPSLDHDAPGATPRASQIVIGDPPASSTRCSFPPAKKPMDLLSGDQKGLMMPGDSTSKRAVVLSSGWTHSPFFPPTAATKAAVLPSGERAIPPLRKPKINRPPSGG